MLPVGPVVNKKPTRGRVPENGTVARTAAANDPKFHRRSTRAAGLPCIGDPTPIAREGRRCRILARNSAVTRETALGAGFEVVESEIVRSRKSESKEAPVGRHAVSNPFPYAAISYLAAVQGGSSPNRLHRGDKRYRRKCSGDGSRPTVPPHKLQSAIPPSSPSRMDRQTSGMASYIVHEVCD